MRKPDVNGDNMRQYFQNHMTVFFVVFLFMGTCATSLASSRTVIPSEPQNAGVIDGQILFAPMDSLTTYLININGNINHTWPGDFLPGESVRWLGDGSILRTIKTGVVGYGGAGGGVQKVLWDGTVVWDFRYDTNGVISHHDVLPLKNGNVLMIAWETKTRDEAIMAGRNPDTFLGDTFLPDHIIEVKPTGPRTGEIVWEWHVWDHLIQDLDPSHENYGVVADHPELVDINYGNDLVLGDWLHTNSIDYNEKFDQILISVHSFNEIWVIDHSTTTAQAASHTGGRSGKGGDLLYRWGNPAAYHTGTADDEKFFGQHDATWIKAGRPGEGNILVFNNRAGNTIRYSSVDEIVPPVNDTGVYYCEPGLPYRPASQIWRYLDSPLTDFYAGTFSGAERLKDGNTLICDGTGGRFFEITPAGTTIWQYTNPYPNPSMNSVFKIVYIPPSDPEPPVSHLPDLECSGSITWNDVKPGATVIGDFQIQNTGDPASLLNWTVNITSITWGTWSLDPEHGENLTPEEGPVTVHVSVVAPDEKNSNFDGYIRVENKDNHSDFGVIPVYLNTVASQDLSLRQIFVNFFERFPNVFPILRHLLGC